MMSITQLLEHHHGELEFNQVMELYLTERIELGQGNVSDADLAVICEECDLSAPDTRVSDSADEQKNITYNQAVQEIDNLSNELQRYAKKKPNGEQLREDSFNAHIQLAELHEHIHRTFRKDSANLETARRHRRDALDLYGNPETSKEKRESAENLLKLGELDLMLGKENCAIHLNESARLFSEVLEGIRNEMGRSKSEDNARLGLAHFNLYKLTEDESHLQKADEILSTYNQNNRTGKYDLVLKQIREIKNG
jgi:hypothetical protein